MAPQGKYRTADEAPKAFVAEADSLGHWVTEADYRAAGYLPEFDELGVRIIQTIWMQIDPHAVPEIEAEIRIAEERINAQKT
jgi:hypothetical protein